MKSFILPGKNPSENLSCSIPFSDMLSVGEIINTISVTITVASGSDPTPSSVLSGVPTTDTTNTYGIFVLTGGVSGATYLISVLVTGSLTTIALKEGYLSIVPTNPF